MAGFKRWFWLGILPGLLVAAMSLFGISRSNLGPSSGRAQEKTPAVKPRQTPMDTKQYPMVGTFSCSARGCHGAIEPSDALDLEKCLQNEYTRWTHDRHADAYRVLFNPRSKNIARLLGGKTPAQEDPRCLACHTNPLVAGLPTDDPFAEQEKLFGVGCESCHGSANKWLVPHTSKTWRGLKQEKWQDFGMIPVTDVARRAEACAGCHVGAPADKAKGLPLRDVNHDLIAAGHPRLMFEFSAFQANMPPHWRDSDKRKPSEKAIPEGHRWAVGQLVAAEAALKLLIERTEAPSPWPEFAEYDCYACHHSLAQPSARQQADRRGRKPGALPWGTWYFALTRQLAGPLDSLSTLERKMQAPYPNRHDVAEKARQALAELKTRRGELSKNQQGDLLARQRILEAIDQVDANWDGAEQLYLALHALQPSEELNKLVEKRAFPPGFDSPNSFPTVGAPPFQPRIFLEKLKALPK